MNIIKSENGCVLFLPEIIEDLRGRFTIPFSVQEIKKMGYDWKETYQLNHSFTNVKGTLRGPNYQDIYPQAKVVRCVRGSLYSVGICLKGKNKGKWAGFELTSVGMEEMYIPRGYAHGFITLEDNTELEYLTDNKYCCETAKAIKWDDLGIDWTVGGKVEVRTDLLSDKNKYAKSLIKNIV